MQSEPERISPPCEEWGKVPPPKAGVGGVANASDSSGASWWITPAIGQVGAIPLPHAGRCARGAVRPLPRRLGEREADDFRRERGFDHPRGLRGLRTALPPGPPRRDA